jgi:hypothetical protein
MGALSDFAVGSGTSVSAATALPGITTGALRAGDLAYVSVPNNGVVPSPTSPDNVFFAFVPWAKNAVAPGQVYYADIANGNALNPGRWIRLDITFAVQPSVV